MVDINEAREVGIATVIYGLPLVMMDLTMRSSTNVETPKFGGAPVNQFGNMRAFPTAAFKQVVRANVDTLYSSAFLDLSVEPLVLSVPDEHGRYYLLPMFDAWTNVFATPGKRTMGSHAHDFLITGPEWKGASPPQLTVLRSPTNIVWILGRTQTNGPDDYPVVHAIQDQYQLVPLSKFGKPYSPPLGKVDLTIDHKTPPVERLRTMSTQDFFNSLARLMKSNPPAAADAPMLEKLAGIGLLPGQPFDLDNVDPLIRKELEGSVSLALQRLQGAMKQFGKAVNGWRIPQMNLGAYGTEYIERAIIALIAFGANLPADAIYPTAFVDADGKALNGANRYVLHFDKNQSPPVNAFWSVTLYGADSFFVSNTIDRYAISSWMPLKYSADGSLDIYIQKEPADGDKRSNWLPSGDADFNLTLRMYWPKESAPSIFDGSWTPPGVQRCP
jgi:hypothetical protein